MWPFKQEVDRCQISNKKFRTFTQVATKYSNNDHFNHQYLILSNILNIIIIEIKIKYNILILDLNINYKYLIFQC